MDHAERIEEFRLCIFWWNTRAYQIFSKLFSGASCIQNLAISMKPISKKSPNNFLPQATPTPWHSWKLGSLTTLSLHSIPPFLQQGIVEFLDTLSCMQDLAHLYVDGALTTARDFISSVEFSAFQKINLPHLSCLLIIAPLSTVIAFVFCVTLPPQTEVRLNCGYEREYYNHNTLLDLYTLLASILAQNYNKDQALSIPTIHSVAIKSDGYSLVLVFGTSTKCDYNPSFSMTPLKWDHNILLKIIVNFHPSVWHSGAKHRHIITFGSKICFSMPVTNVQSLHVIGPPFCPAFWRMALGHLPGLRYIKLSRGYMPDLASVLSQTAQEPLENPSGCVTSDGDPTDRILAPALEELDLCRIWFSSDLPGVAISQRSLLDTLSTRKTVRVTIIESPKDIHSIDHSDSSDDDL